MGNFAIGGRDKHTARHCVKDGLLSYSARIIAGTLGSKTMGRHKVKLVNSQSSIVNPKAFTLIELLVVISIIALKEIKKEGRKEMVRVTPARIYPASAFIAILYRIMNFSRRKLIKNL